MSSKFRNGTSQRASGIALAYELADMIEAGNPPRPMTPPFRLERNELCFYCAPASLQVFASGGDGTYVHKTNFGFSPLGFAMGAATMMGNGVRASRARHDAMEAWREAGQGVVYFTNARLCIQTGQSWSTVWYQDVMTAGNDGAGIQLQRTNGDSALRIVVPDVDFFFTVLYWLAFNQVVRPAAS